MLIKSGGSTFARMVMATAGFAMVASLVCAPRGASAADSKALVDVNIGGLPGLAQMFYPYVATQKRFFENRGIKPNMVHVSTGPGLVIGLLGGSSDISMAGPQLLWPPIKKGEPVVVLAGAIKLNYLLVTCGDTPVPHARDPYPGNLQDLRGKSIGAIGLGTQTMNFAESLTRAAGFVPDQDVKLVAVGAPPTMIPACKQRKVDFIIAPPPVEQLLGTEGKDYVIVASASDPRTSGPTFDGLLADTYSTTGTYLKEHRAQVTAFCAAMADARAFATNPANLAETARMFAEYTQIPLDKAETFWKRHQNELLVPITRASWTRQAAGVKGELNTFVPDFDKHVDPVCSELLAQSAPPK